MKRRREPSKAEEITNAILHGIGLGLAVAALVVLIVLSRVYGEPRHLVGFTIYGSTLVILYLSSTLYHSFPRGKVKDIFRIFDHSAIFLLIAGTYTPFTLILLQGRLGLTIFAIVWSLAVFGIVTKILWLEKLEVFSIILYVVMGWLVVIAIKPLAEALDRTSLLLLAGGGLCYMVGLVFYGLRQLKYNHAIWHLFVLGGSVSHFFTVLFMLPD